MTAVVSSSPLSPLPFLERAGRVFGDRIAVVDGGRRMTYAELSHEALQLANAMRASGVRPGDRVAYLAPNATELLVAHFAVPLAEAILVAINTRLSPEEIRYIVEHAGARLLIVDVNVWPSVAPIARALSDVEVVIVGAVEDRPSYAGLRDRGSQTPLRWAPAAETDAIAINYTSGTTGRPKGVVYSHRGAALNALGEIIHSGFDGEARYLWTLPMFHCNGWCTAWAVTAAAGRHVCLPAVRGEAIWSLVEQEQVTHLNAAPTVLTTIAECAHGRRFPRPITVTTAGAPPSPTVIATMEGLGARIVHVYGLTETYGPYAICEPQEAWSGLDAGARARMLARQGVAMVQCEPLHVVDEDMRGVPADGVTIGEIVMRGNNVMTGYYRDEAATAEAFRGGWFHSGDLGVMHPDGYVELRDRAKDVIISGGENISTIEIEQAIASHPAVLEVAVVGVPDARWGERPKAFVTLRADGQVSEDQLIEHVRAKIARFKAPKAVVFVDELPKTSTGKVQKVALREREWAGQASRIRG